MSNAVAVRGNALPALPDHIRKATAKLGKNDDVNSGLGGGFLAPPRISIEGGKFSVVIDGSQTFLTRTDEDGNKVGVTSLKGVILGANRGKYKLFYGVKYDPEGDVTAPLCYSFDGEKPSPFANEKQCETCAACPHNVWGSSITESGKKSRACSDNKLLAFLPLHAVTKQAEAESVDGKVYAVKVTPSALSRNRKDRNDDPANNTSLAEYISLLDNYPIDGDSAEVPVSAVVTNLFFEINSQFPLLRFKLARFLSDAEIEYVASRKEGDDVRRIVEDQATEGKMLPAPKPEPEVKATPKPPKDEDDEAFGSIPTLATAKPQAAAAQSVSENPKRTRRTPVGSKKAEETVVTNTTSSIDAELASLDGLFGNE